MGEKLRERERRELKRERERRKVGIVVWRRMWHAVSVSLKKGAVTGENSHKVLSTLKGLFSP